MTEPTLPFMETVLVREVPIPDLPPCEFPFFVVGWHQHSLGWSIHKQLWRTAECDGIKRQIADLAQRGWIRIKVMRLPL